MKTIMHLAVLVSLTMMSHALFAQERKPQSEFDFNLYRTVVKNEPDKNIAVSPYGVQKLLDLARYGAAGETKTEIEQVLGYTQPVKWETRSDGTLSLAAALWTQQGFSILPGFLRTARGNFGSAIEQVDFARNPKEALRRINKWCSDNTKGKITSLFDDIDPLTRLVLANAIYFAADWQTPFNARETRDDDFTLQDGTKVKTKIMGLFGRQWKYGEYGETLSLELPYKATGYAMVLLMPQNPEGFAEWESAMTAEEFALIRRSMETQLVSIRMPKFTMEAKISLNDTLKQLGMLSAFDAVKADFSKINATEPLYVGEVLQKTFVKVDELGTEAAAVTAMRIAYGSPDPPKLKLFYADRPFLYAIMKGDTILFLGRFVKP